MLQPTGRKCKSVSKVQHNSAKSCLGTAGQNFLKMLSTGICTYRALKFLSTNSCLPLVAGRKIKSKFIATEERAKAAIIAETTISIQCERDAYSAILRSQERFRTLQRTRRKTAKRRLDNVDEVRKLKSTRLLTLTSRELLCRIKTFEM
jgi:hypothetical protein